MQYFLVRHPIINELFESGIKVLDELASAATASAKPNVTNKNPVITEKSDRERERENRRFLRTNESTTHSGSRPGETHKEKASIQEPGLFLTGTEMCVKRTRLQVKTEKKIISVALSIT